MKRFFCDRCDKDITDAPSSAIHGIEDAEENGDGRHTDSHDHVCRDCYQAWREFMEGHKEGLAAAEHNAAVDLLCGMVGLVQLIQEREPLLLTNHRYVDAMAWLAERELAVKP